MDRSENKFLKFSHQNPLTSMCPSQELHSFKIISHKVLHLSAAFGQEENSLNFLKRTRVKGLFSQKKLNFKLKRVLPEHSSYFEGWCYIRALSHNSNINSLSLDFGMENPAKPNVTTSLETSSHPLFNQILRKNKGMKVFRLRTYNKDLERFSVLGSVQHLTRLHNLEEFSIYINSRINRSESFLSLAPAMKYLRNLKVLSLNLSNRVIEANAFNPFLASSSLGDSISKVLKRTSKVEEIYLGPKLELDKHALNSLALILPKLNRLRVFDFDCVSQESSYDPLFAELCKSSNIKNLAVNFSPEIQKTSNVQAHLSSVSKSNQLDNLTVRFETEATHETNISGNIIGGLKVFQNIKSLDLELNFGWAVVTKQQLGGCERPLTEALFDWRDSLEKLNIHFMKVRNEEVESIIEALPALKNLKSLSLWIDNSSLFSDKHLQNLLYSIAELDSLEQLNLKFDECSDISTDGFIPFKKSLNHLKLKSFEFKINSCFNVSNPAVTGIMSFISKQTQLAELSLCFDQCFSINAGILSTFSHLLKLKELEALKLVIQRCKKINQKNLTPKQEESISGLVDSISSFKHLKELWITQDFFSEMAVEQLKNNYKLKKLNFCNL